MEAYFRTRQGPGRIGLAPRKDVADAPGKTASPFRHGH